MKELRALLDKMETEYIVISEKEIAIQMNLELAQTFLSLKEISQKDIYLWGIWVHVEEENGELNWTACWDEEY